MAIEVGALDGLLKPQPARTRSSTGSSRAVCPARVARTDIEFLPSPLPAIVNARLRQEVKPEKRSSDFAALVLLCVEFGFTRGQCIAVAAHHPPTRDKYASEDEIAHQVEVLYDLHDHMGSNCFDVACPVSSANRTPEREVFLDTLYRLASAAHSFEYPSLYRKRAASLDKMLISCLMLARDVGQTEFDLSVREMAERAAIAINTAADRLHDLEELGWIVCVRRSGRHHVKKASRYRLLTTHIATSIDSGGRALLRRRYVADDEVDTFRRSTHPDRRPLGPTARRVWHAVREQKLKPADIAAAGITSAPYAREMLGRLHGVGLVDQDADGWWYGLDGDFGALADHLGVQGRSGEVRQRHRHDRAMHELLNDPYRHFRWPHVFFKFMESKGITVIDTPTAREHRRMSQSETHPLDERRTHTAVRPNQATGTRRTARRPSGRE